MCKRRLANLIRKGMMAIETLLTSPQLLGVVDRDCILGAAAILLKENLISLSDLDAYIISTWITTEEKVLIVNEANTL